MIVVTGAAGFIGSCFIWKLNHEGIDDILAVDCGRTPPFPENLAARTIKDYSDKDVFLTDLKSGKYNGVVETVFHIGACSSTLESDLKFLMNNNYEYSRQLAEWCLAEECLFYYASSAATYGDGRDGYLDMDENTVRLSPLNKYAYSKHLFDMWVLAKKLTSAVTGFKYFNVYGPNEYHKAAMRSMVLKSFEQIMQSNRVRLFKSYHPDYRDGEQRRDFVYVKDVVEVMFEFYCKPHIRGIYNVGTGRSRTWKELVGALFSALGREPVVEYIDMPEAIKGKYQYFTEADLGKLRRAGIVYECQPLADTVADYASYLTRHTYI